MRFLADESCDALIVRTLRAQSHDVAYVAEESPGVEDEDVLTRALQDQRVILTEDRDFCALVFRDALPTYGIVLIRILPAQRLRKKDRIMALLDAHADRLAGAMTTLTVGGMRVRPLPK